MLKIVELPTDGSQLATTPLLYAAATGADQGWRRAALFRFRAETETAEAAGRTAPRAVSGIATTLLRNGEPWRIDRRRTVDVLLDNGADALISVDDALLLQGANLCTIGDEVLQFAMAEPVGPRHYRLSRLVRGWYGTEWACDAHEAGEAFVLLDPSRLTPLESSVGDIGHMLELRAIGSGDAVPAEASRLVDGRALFPPSPVHAHTAELAGGDLAISWIRRSRLGWVWGDYGDAPLGEEREAYVVRVIANGATLRIWKTADPTLTYLAEERSADRLAAGAWPLRLEIRQVGTMGESRPLIIDLP